MKKWPLWIPRGQEHTALSCVQIKFCPLQNPRLPAWTGLPPLGRQQTRQTGRVGHDVPMSIRFAPQERNSLLITGGEWDPTPSPVFCHPSLLSPYQLTGASGYQIHLSSLTGKAGPGNLPPPALLHMWGKGERWSDLQPASPFPPKRNRTKKRGGVLAIPACAPHLLQGARRVLRLVGHLHLSRSLLEKPSRVCQLHEAPLGHSQGPAPSCPPPQPERNGAGLELAALGWSAPSPEHGQAKVSSTLSRSAAATVSLPMCPCHKKWSWHLA